MQFSVGGFQLLQGSIDTPDALTYRNKMRFLATGPNFPDDLLEARDAGNVVFFCGAGLSSPALPGFSGLAEQVISEFGPPPGSDALAIRDQIRSGALLSSPLDQVFNLLHEDYGAAAVEDVVNTILKKKSATAPIDQHSIVLRLSRSAAHRPQVELTLHHQRSCQQIMMGIRHRTDSFRVRIVPTAMEDTSGDLTGAVPLGPADARIHDPTRPGSPKRPKTLGNFQATARTSANVVTPT